MSDATDIADIDRARLAQDVLENPVYQQAHSVVEQELIRLWREARSTQDREQLHQMLLMLGKTKTAVEEFMRIGKLSAENLRQKQSLLQRVGSRLQSA